MEHIAYIPILLILDLAIDLISPFKVSDPNAHLDRFLIFLERWGSKC